MHPRFAYALLSVLALTACSSASSDGSPAPPDTTPPPAAPPPDAQPIHGTFHFFVDQGGKQAEVTKIVYTDEFEVRLEGLPPHVEVDLTTRTYSPTAKNQGYTSKVTFTSDAMGAIDTKTMAPIRGSYSGIDPDGVIWSMTATPLEEGLGPDRAAAFFHADVAGKGVADAALGRLVMAEGVKTSNVTDDGLVAAYYAPAGVTDKVPIVCFGGSEGGISSGEFYAERFASWGYPALGVAYFGAAGVPRNLDQIPLEYFQKAFTWLDKQPETRKGKAVVVGGSRGGELALQLGATFPNVAGVIAETPSSYRWGAVATNGDAAWTYQGTPLPFLSGDIHATPPTETTPDGQTAWVERPWFEQTLASTPPDQLEAARIAVEKTQGPVLMIGGDSDKMWPACDFINRAMQKLTDDGHVAQYADEGVCYPNAGHWVGGVGLPTGDSMYVSDGTDTFALGGTAEGNGRSGRPAEAKMRALLERVSK
jgi:pimeloyl-ACP methyl ester carboxylesterase